MNTARALLFIAAWVAVWGMWKQHERIEELHTQNARLLAELTEQIKINEDFQERVQSLHKLDIKHTQELANAQIEIDQLRIAAERHPERVYIKASCKKSEGTTASGLDDATTARPDDAAIRNYWLLRERIAESTQIILGLQDYIKMQCIQ
ncbi:lysis protein [Providencia vermicola]|uniref:lysis protein n=1 Tax=Providencia TaxID=586 RepID=UPI0012B64B57|nr:MULTISPECIES: lysis protein [Providencia]ELR5121636.1 lysis protein [Providencia stuartii]ELR5141114.1 lysis protein [Providencia stuartii]MBG5918906.1 lysis protein [Providencia stuartii]MTB41775.1 lysis protein [Providencia sp. wls1949]MTC06632.1 lysis protein [Providencia sp. wls1948]